MDYRRILWQVIRFISYVGIQVILLKNLVVFDVAFCFVYIGFLLFLPLDTSRPLLMIIGFFLGLTIDIFYDSLGIHAAACVLIGALRPLWVKFLTPQGGYDLGISPGLVQMRYGWFTAYALILILVHHITIFYVEAGGFSMFFFTLVKVISTAIFTFLVIILFQLLFSRNKAF